MVPSAVRAAFRRFKPLPGTSSLFSLTEDERILANYTSNELVGHLSLSIYSPEGPWCKGLHFGQSIQGWQGEESHFRTEPHGAVLLPYPRGSRGLLHHGKDLHALLCPGDPGVNEGTSTPFLQYGCGFTAILQPGMRPGWHRRLVRQCPAIPHESCTGFGKQSTQYRFSSIRPPCHQHASRRDDGRVVPQACSSVSLLFS